VRPRAPARAPPPQRIGRGDEVVRAGHRPRERGEGIRRPGRETRHVLEHRGQAPLIRAEPDEHRPVVGDGPERHVASEDLPEPVLVRARDVRVLGLVLELGAVVLRTPHHVLLPLDREGLPRGRVVDPLLEQEDRAAGTGTAFGDQRHVGRVDQARVLGAVDEPGQIPVVPVRPARRLLRDGGEAVELGDRGARGVEDHVVRAAGEPEDGVVLRRGHRGTGDAHDVSGEPLDLGGVAGHEPPPQLGPEAGDEVHAAHRRAWLAQPRDGSHGLLRGGVVAGVELEVRMRRRAEREDPGLRDGHPRILDHPPDGPPAGWRAPGSTA
jgi:hypothetical protein